MLQIVHTYTCDVIDWDMCNLQLICNLHVHRRQKQTNCVHIAVYRYKDRKLEYYYNFCFATEHRTIVYV